MRKELDLALAARRQHLFPIVGTILGAAVAIIAFLLFSILGNQLSSLAISLLIVLFLYAVSGLIHLEGLADFGDGVMTSGDAERKRAAMKDVSLGAAGIFLIVVNCILLIFLIGELDGWTDAIAPWIWGGSIPAVLGLILAELSAKLSMLTVMFLGPSSHDGMGQLFVSAANSRRFLIGVILSISIAIALSWVYFFVVLIGIVVGVAITYMARNHFGGVGGDAFGASNEIGRLAALLVWVIIL